MDQNTSYDSLDTPALTNLLLNPEQSSDVHQGALSALARRSVYQRSPTVMTILRSVITHADRYDQHLMMQLIDILATDPDSEATVAMLEVLPDMLEAGIDPHGFLKAEFREYFYTAMVTRQREDDLLVWGDMLPQLAAKTLVAALIDPAAGSLQAIEPLTLIDRMDEPSRTKALVSVISGVAHMGHKPETVQGAVDLITRSSDDAQLEDGLSVLAGQYEKAKKAGRDSQAGLLEQALRILDTEPRSTSERLTGKRPWAP